jgi:hypothetical protein
MFVVHFYVKQGFHITVEWPQSFAYLTKSKHSSPGYVIKIIGTSTPGKEKRNSAVDQF